MAAPRSVPFHRPSIGENEIRAVVETLRSGWITTGPQTIGELLGNPAA